MKVKRKKILNEDGLDINDYRGCLDEILDLPEKEVKHLIEVGRAVAIKTSAKSKKK
jgi:hypothetical protein